MVIGKVVGHVVSTRKNENLVGQKLLIIEPNKKLMGNVGPANFIAIDNVGAGITHTVQSGTLIQRRPGMDTR